MKSTQRFVDERYNKSLLKYEFANGSFIEFFSADDSSKLRGGRRSILYINECNSVSFESFNELSIRTKDEVFLDYNPTAEFWVQTELEGQEDAEKIILTYKDNEALDKGIIDQIEKNIKKAETSNYWRNWVRVYVDGEMGQLEGVVFSNWKPIDTIPNEARLIGIGVDFGYTNDPTSIIEVYKMNETRILNEVTYQTGLLNSDIAKILPRDVPVYADSAEPKSIRTIQLAGVTIKGVTKGRDSINYGIDVMQRENYLVTSQSTNLIKELRSYCWDTDKTGKRLNKPISMFDHAIDAVRYHEMETLGMNKNYGSYNIL
jgi:phage terminase large subunit